MIILMPKKDSIVKSKEAMAGVLSPLPPVGDLLRESWEVFKKALRNLILVSVIVLVIFFLIAIVFAVLLLAIAAGTGLFSTAAGSLGILGAIPAWVYGSMAVLVLAFILLLILAGSFESIAFILAVSRADKEMPLGTILRESLPLIVPFFLTSLLIMFFSVGGVLFFILPVFIFYIFFIFAPYEVVLNHKSYLSALRQSFLIVKSRFSAVTGRVLAIFAIYIAVAIVIPNLLASLSPRLTFFVNSLSFIVNTILGWFILTYLVTLYTYAKVGVEKKGKPSLVWAWMIAIVGWMIGVLILVSTYKLLTSDAVRQIITNIQNQEMQNLPQKNVLPSEPNLKSL